MKKQTIFVFSSLALALNLATAAPIAELKTDKEKLSYAIGMSSGRNLIKEKTDLDVDIMIQAMRSTLADEKLLMTEKDMRIIMNKFQSDVRHNATISRRQTAEDNRTKGKAFFAENKTKPGVVETASGLQYKIIKEGKGKKPLPSDLAQVHYRGTLLNGAEFDATAPDHPVVLKIASLIPGWKEALELMPVGSKWQIFIPPFLAYGERGVGFEIGPNETLVFELELLAVK